MLPSCEGQQALSNRDVPVRPVPSTQRDVWLSVHIHTQMAQSSVLVGVERMGETACCVGGYISHTCARGTCVHTLTSKAC